MRAVKTAHAGLRNAVREGEREMNRRAQQKSSCSSARVPDYRNSGTGTGTGTDTVCVCVCVQPPTCLTHGVSAKNNN